MAGALLSAIPPMTLPSAAGSFLRSEGEKGERGERNPHCFPPLHRIHRTAEVWGGAKGERVEGILYCFYERERDIEEY